MRSAQNGLLTMGQLRLIHLKVVAEQLAQKGLPPQDSLRSKDSENKGESSSK